MAPPFGLGGPAVLAIPYGAGWANGIEPEMDGGGEDSIDRNLP